MVWFDTEPNTRCFEAVETDLHFNCYDLSDNWCDARHEHRFDISYLNSHIKFVSCYRNVSHVEDVPTPFLRCDITSYALITCNTRDTLSGVVILTSEIISVPSS